ncbi:beta-glucoside-specific PTS transporter subunit IIABC [Pectinatus cerevisiiphilus]|uniref:PTS system beta-glucoside-specific IIA component (Glc family) /PTS system beta-glucoside-specific IIB component (Glc family) /PTS system beta-glucoside-specific IIC component (Glc family) n=1 Tax=Pectinatus cerevisiiphilus TaxID=86956 RepID=A0A4R3KAG2_9FIRM|nr:beta-glucoside-specific PTS transporter subunit IIABC [Pectinatus cerevisiiphilus]TCS80086.1 PTS system beta-glucoside-specific IIA component (Glc family) /PTS system beta-glucoside-specific IIB component (Glc family) /PTS system beta-glucoside-specific IIC component (Glc family) [Pectinatus cerevisiiphilus]
MKKYEQLAKTIMENIGGEKNVISVTHCITRLRFKLHDENKAKTEILKSTDGIVTVVQSGGQYQVVIGNAVGDVYDTILDVFGISANKEAGNDVANKKIGLLDRFIDTVSGIFTPVLGVLAASGMVKGFTALLVALSIIDAKGGTYQILTTVGDGFFYFLPIFLGLTAARKFKMSEFTAMGVGAALVYPTLSAIMKGQTLYELMGGTLFASQIKIEFIGIPVILMNYASSVIPIIIAVYFGAKIERIIAKFMPTVLKGFMVPFCTLLIVIPLTFIVIGPIATWAGQLVGAVATGIFNLSPVLAGIFIGGLWQVFVMFGLHWGLVPIMLNNVSVMGFDPVIVTYFGATFAQIGVVLAIMLRTKDKKLKALAAPAFISGIFGVTEPAIYGVTLPRKKYFIISCIGAGIGGAVIAFFGVKLFVFGGLGIFGYPCFINTVTNDVSGMYYGILASAVSFLAGFVITFPIYRDEKNITMTSSTAGKEQIVKQEIIKTPIMGKIVPLGDVPDEAFASGVLGKGIAVDPLNGQVIAPTDCTVVTLFSTGHAVGLITDKGIELLIHVGIDTVKLEGKYFTVKIKQGEHVKKGQILIEFDVEKIKAAGYSTITPVLVTNHTEYLDIIPTNKKEIKKDDTLITVVI